MSSYLIPGDRPMDTFRRELMDILCRNMGLGIRVVAAPSKTLKAPAPDTIRYLDACSNADGSYYVFGVQTVASALGISVSEMRRLTERVRTRHEEMFSMQEALRLFEALAAERHG
jgi:hypothetical protein